jgi:inhibitor of cysteine peptidase
MAPAKAFDRVSNGTTVRAQPGDNLTISLAENPTTGYSWNVTTTGGLAITKDEYVLSDASGNLVGSGGIHTWYLTAGQAATQKFTAIYKRPWEQTTGNEMMFVMTFTVSEATGGMVFNETNNGTTVTLPMNTPFAIRLNENPTTGFSWNATISDSLTVISDQYIPPEAVRPGAGGVHEWSLKGTKAGTQTFSAIYKRPWEAATGSEPSFAMTFRIGSGSL